MTVSNLGECQLCDQPCFKLHMNKHAPILNKCKEACIPFYFRVLNHIYQLLEGLCVYQGLFGQRLSLLQQLHLKSVVSIQNTLIELNIGLCHTLSFRAIAMLVPHYLYLVIWHHRSNL